MLQIRSAGNDDYSDVRSFYASLIETLQEAEYSPGWEIDIYPTQEFLIRSIECGELYIGEAEGQIVSCMVVNHQYNEGYKEVRWSVEAEDSELLIIHLLGVHPMYSGQGVAKQMVQQVIKTAKENGIKTIRLDVLEGNIPAEKSYTKVGFTYLDTVQMFYEDTGWTGYKLFEYLILYETD